MYVCYFCRCAVFRRGKKRIFVDTDFDTYLSCETCAVLRGDHPVGEFLPALKSVDAYNAYQESVAKNAADEERARGTTGLVEVGTDGTFELSGDR